MTRKGLFVRLEIPQQLRPLEPEISLGRAILDRAFLDTFESSVEREWFDSDNPDFNDICFIAALEEDLVLHYVSVVTVKLNDCVTLEEILKKTKLCPMLPATS